MKKTFIPLLFTLFFAVSCQNNPSTSSGSDSTATESQSAPKGKYAVKSGIVEYKTQMMGMEMNQTMTFDDYGNKEAIDVMMEMMGVKVHNVTINKEGFTYNLDMEKKTGTKVATNPMASANIDFQNLTEELKTEMNLKKEGTEEFLGKTCDKISIDYTKMQMKGSFLVYNGVALKAEMEMSSMKIVLEALKYEENVDVPADKFDVPADFKITGM